jgi:DNA-binding NarL/FixJ family response regulator
MVNPLSENEERPPAPTAVTSAKCRIMLVDDHAFLRMGVRAILETEADFEVIAEAGGTDEALAILAVNTPDVVIVDLAMPGRGGLALLTELKSRFPSVRALVLSGHDTEECIRTSLEHGALGYVLKDASYDELLKAIRLARTGEHYLCSAVSKHVVSYYLGGTPRPRAKSGVALVSRREREVLTRVAEGDGNKKIAADLGLSVKTVRKHRQNVMRKLSLHNSAAITVYAIENGFLFKDPAA